MHWRASRGSVMGIEASYRRITPVRFASLEAEPEEAMRFFYPGLGDPEEMIASLTVLESRGERFDLGKEWHALHFLLTGESDLGHPSAPPPLGNVVLGGTPTPFE